MRQICKTPCLTTNCTVWRLHVHRDGLPVLYQKSNICSHYCTHFIDSHAIVHVQLIIQFNRKCQLTYETVRYIQRKRQRRNGNFQRALTRRNANNATIKFKYK